MKIKLSFFAFLIICGLLFSALTLTGCDFLKGDDNNGNVACVHTWKWDITTPPPDDGEDAVEKDSIAVQICEKCNATGRIVTIPAGSDPNEFLEDIEEEDSSDTDGNDYYEPDGDVTETPNLNRVVGPLITTIWTQGSPYNDLFPMVNGKRSVTDCGNIAMSQILRFHRNPAKGNGQSTSVRINSNTITVPTVNINVTYDWDNILDSYRANSGNAQQRNAVATLVYHYAAAVGASMGAGSYPRNYLAALTNIMGYDKSIQLRRRAYYNDNDWAAMIRQQLDAGLPVYYWGKRDGHSHAFVVDGYDSNGKFHINWGWGGKDNGWYALNNLNPPSTGHYKYNNIIFVNIKPDVGGKPADYEMALNNFSANKTSVTQNELFTVTMQIRNISTFGAFSGGQQGVALVNNNDEIIAVIGNNNRAALNQLSLAGTATISCNVPETIIPGQYRVMAVIRKTGEEWRVITRSAIGNGVPNAIPIKINAETGTPGGGYGLSLREFSTDKKEVPQNETFAVTVNFRNRGAEQFPGGTAGAVLVDNDSYITHVLGTRSRGTLNPGSTWSSSTTIQCTVPYSVETGNHRLRIAVKTATGDWRIATLAEGDIPTAINLKVTEGAGILGGGYDALVASYSGATANVDIVINEDLTIKFPVNHIRAPAGTGATLTIRSANSAQPVTLTRGTSGDLFVVPAGATLVFSDIIIDGGSGGAFAESGGGTLVRVNSGSFTMNAGAVLRNNANMAATGSNTSAVNGGGVVVSGTGTFTMNGGEITGNKSGFEAGGVYVDQNTTFNMTGGKINGNTADNTGGVYARRSTFTMSGGQINSNTSATNAGGVRVLVGTFTMSGGEISGNTATADGGGIYIENSGTFTMTGGEIFANTAGGNGNGVRRASGTFNLNGGAVAGTGTAITNVISGTYILNAASPNNAVIIAWNRPADTPNYTAGSNTNLTVSAGGTAVWENQGGVLGISYTNGSNTGWIKQW